MNYIYKLFLLLIVIISTSCQATSSQKINLEDIRDSSTRTYTDQAEESILFYNAKNQVISSDEFNQFLAEGLYLSESKKNSYDQEEIHLISLVDYRQKLESKLIPEFEFKDLNGNIYNNNSLKGKITVLSFWFTASFICSQKIQEINSLSQKIKSDKVQWISPALDKAPELSRFLKNTDWTTIFVPDQEEFALELGILTYPTHLIINEEGKIYRAITHHQSSVETIENNVKNLLKN